MGEDIEKKLEKVKKDYPEHNIKIKPINSRFTDILIVFYNISLILISSIVAVTTTPYALLALLFLASSESEYEVEIMKESGREYDKAEVLELLEAWIETDLRPSGEYKEDYIFNERDINDILRQIKKEIEQIQSREDYEG